VISRRERPSFWRSSNSTGAAPDLGRKEVLELQELELRILELKRPFWKSPAVVTSAVIALLTGATGYFSGFFQLQLDKAKYETEKQAAVLSQAKLETERQGLVKERIQLEAEQLTARRNALDSEIAILKRQVAKLDLERSSLQARVRSLDDSLKSAMAPRLSVETLEYFSAPTDDLARFAISFINNGTGPLKLLPYDIYVDSQFVATAHEREDWIMALRNLRMNRSWVRFVTTGSNARELQTFAPGESRDFLSIFDGQQSKVRVLELKSARMRLGFVICYCSAKHCGTYRFGVLPDSAKTCRTNIKATDLSW
jgi:hypothetical protein